MRIASADGALHLTYRYARVPMLVTAIWVAVHPGTGHP